LISFFSVSKLTNEYIGNKTLKLCIYLFDDPRCQ